ncbi:MAG TPA: glycosyltransferase family 2 protein [Terriglobales bacterium]|nr:glycosyltransferase family 2 protein [Terriglobales bacterium]
MHTHEYVRRVDHNSQTFAGAMTSDAPKVSIIILTWNSYEVTRDCLASIDKIDYPNREVLVVDNGSGDGSPDRLAEEFPFVRFIRNERNLGFTGGNNVGIRVALTRRPDYLLLLNNDTVVASNFLSQMIDLAETDPTIGILTPKIYFADPSDRIWFAGGRYRKGRSFPECFGMGRRDDGSYDQTREVSFVSGCAFLIKTEVVEKIGLLDESLFLGFEDLDWSIRAANAGFKAMYVANAVIWHKEGYDTKKNLGKAGKDFYYVRNSIVMARKHLSRVYWPLFALSLSKYLAYRSLGYLIRGEPGRVKALLRGIPAGYLVTLESHKFDALRQRTPDVPFKKEEQ